MDVMVEDIAKAYEHVQALRPTSLHIRKGTFTTLLGPSGCGKTTLLRMIAGLAAPDQGDILLGGECIYSHAKKVNMPVHRRNFGMVFQDFALWPHMTVFENVAFGLRATGRGKEVASRVQAAIAKVQLPGLERRYPHQLSGGQQQRVAFARAVVTQPRLVLLDEPLSALDALLREEMRLEMVALVRESGLTALHVTHDQNEAMAMSDEIVVMNSGAVLQVGTPEEIYQHPTDPFVASFIGKSNWLEPGRRMFRPEQIEWSPSANAAEYRGWISGVSYVGDRYELQLGMEGGGQWTAYHHRRLAIGEAISVFVPAEKIRQF